MHVQESEEWRLEKCTTPQMHVQESEEWRLERRATPQMHNIGYPERMPLDEFYWRYKALDFSQNTPQELILRMADLLIMKPGLWVLGHTKLLMKHEQNLVGAGIHPTSNRSYTDLSKYTQIPGIATASIWPDGCEFRSFRIGALLLKSTTRTVARLSVTGELAVHCSKH
eukprot:7422046-Pyramimonas_sp.AAC.1